MYTCPVCGYNELSHAPVDWTICPSCLTMFGYSDENWGVEVLRQEWIQAGAMWGSEDIAPPAYWSPIEQLRSIGYEATDADKISIAHARASESGLVALIEFQIGQMHIVVPGPVEMLGTQHNIVLTPNTFRQESSDSQKINIAGFQPA